MKKILLMCLAFIMMVSIAGCSDTSDKKEVDVKASETPKEEVKVEEKEEEVAEDVMIGTEFKTGPYLVTINSVKKIKDYEGNDAVVLNFDWTNESEETTSWLGSMSTDIFQDGVQLETAVIMEGMDSEPLMKQVRPGTKLEGIENAFISKSENTLEIEVVALEKMFNEDDKILIKTDYPTE